MQYILYIKLEVQKNQFIEKKNAQILHLFDLITAHQAKTILYYSFSPSEKMRLSKLGFPTLQLLYTPTLPFPFLHKKLLNYNHGKFMCELYSCKKFLSPHMNWHVPTLFSHFIICRHSNIERKGKISPFQYTSWKVLTLTSPFYKDKKSK